MLRRFCRRPSHATDPSFPAGTAASDEVTGKIDIRTAVGPIVKSPQLGQDGSGNFVSGDMFRLTVSGEGFDDISEIYTVGETELFLVGFGASG